MTESIIGCSCFINILTELLGPLTVLCWFYLTLDDVQAIGRAILSWWVDRCKISWEIDVVLNCHWTRNGVTISFKIGISSLRSISLGRMLQRSRSRINSKTLRTMRLGNLLIKAIVLSLSCSIFFFVSLFQASWYSTTPVYQRSMAHPFRIWLFYLVWSWASADSTWTRQVQI